MTKRERRTYTPEFKHPAYYQLAVAKAREGRFEEALSLIDECLITGAHDLQALTVKMYILRNLGNITQNRDLNKNLIKKDRVKIEFRNTIQY